MGSLLAIVLLAAAPEPSVSIQGTPAHAQVEGEHDSFALVEPGDELRMTAVGPGKLVLDLRGYARHLEPVVAPSLEVELDGNRVAVPAISKPANRQVTSPGGFTSNSTLVELSLSAGTHQLRVRAGERGTPALVGTTFIGTDTDLDFLPPTRHKPTPAVAAAVPIVAAPLASPAELQAHEDALELETNPNARHPVALEVGVGLATHLQLGGTAPLISASADLQLGPKRAFSIGVDFDYLRMPLLIDAPLPPPEGSAALSGTLASIPLMVHAAYRPLEGSVQPFVGVGAGVTLATLTLTGAGQSSVALPSASAEVGAGIWLGPGEVVVAARVVASQGDFPGVATRFQAGGAGVQAGYRFEL